MCFTPVEAVWKPLQQSRSGNPFLATYLEVNICHLHFQANKQTCTALQDCSAEPHLFQFLLNMNAPPNQRVSSHTIVGRKGIDDKFQVYTFREYLQALSGVVLHLMIFLILSRLTRSE